jgi:putative transposase
LLILLGTNNPVCDRRSVNRDYARGSQYRSASFQKALPREEIDRSMSRKGNRWDNAVAESFFATLKKELVHQCAYGDPKATRASIFEYIDACYNQVRRHSAMGSMSP